jgi:hypothetical protein
MTEHKEAQATAGCTVKLVKNYLNRFAHNEAPHQKHSKQASIAE